MSYHYYSKISWLRNEYNMIYYYYLVQCNYLYQRIYLATLNMHIVNNLNPMFCHSFDGQVEMVLVHKKFFPFQYYIISIVF
jgi:hypothetical protein